MITARPALSTTRTRHQAGPLRLLWLTALLFAFLYTHAAGADTASAHVTSGAVAIPTWHPPTPAEQPTTTTSGTTPPTTTRAAAATPTRRRHAPPATHSTAVTCPPRTWPP